VEIVGSDLNNQENPQMNNKADEEKTFNEKIEEFNAGERETNPFNEISTWKLVGGFLITSGFVGAGIGAFIAGSFFWGTVLIMIPIGLWFVFTKTGRESLNSFAESMEELEQGQQGQNKKSKPKKICTECGWQNHVENNYCNDCGTELE